MIYRQSIENKWFGAATVTSCFFQRSCCPHYKGGSGHVPLRDDGTLNLWMARADVNRSEVGCGKVPLQQRTGLLAGVRRIRMNERNRDLS
jgi:hypothetical protein